MTTLRAHVQSAIAQARHRISKYDDTRFPVDIRALAQDFGIASILPVPLHIDGYLARLNDNSLAIRYRAANSESRNRFTIAHELGHLLLAEAQGNPITRSNREFTRDPSEEKAVSRIGSELLMPEKGIARILGRDDAVPKWQLIRQMQHMFRVSESAMVLRMLELWSTATVLFRLNQDEFSKRVCPNLPVDVSENRQLRLLNDYGIEATRIMHEATTSTKHSVSVEVAGVRQDVVCEGSWRNIRTRKGVARQYWCIGWKVSPRRIVALAR